jgi:hypothetical protein
MRIGVAPWGLECLHEGTSESLLFAIQFLEQEFFICYAERAVVATLSFWEVDWSSMVWMR